MNWSQLDFVCNSLSIKRTFAECRLLWKISGWQSRRCIFVLFPFFRVSLFFFRRPTLWSIENVDFSRVSSNFNVISGHFIRYDLLQNVTMYSSWFKCNFNWFYRRFYRIFCCLEHFFATIVNLTKYWIWEYKFFFFKIFKLRFSFYKQNWQRILLIFLQICFNFESSDETLKTMFWIFHKIRFFPLFSKLDGGYIGIVKKSHLADTGKLFSAVCTFVKSQYWLFWTVYLFPSFVFVLIALTICIV